MRQPQAWENHTAAARQELFSNVIGAMAGLTGKPILYGPTGKPLQPSGAFGYRREASQRKGSLENWRPQKVFGKQAEAMERQEIVARSIDLSNNDPHAAGIIDNFAATVIGSGLTPHPVMDLDVLGIDKEKAVRLRGQMKNNWLDFAPTADAGGRMSIGQVSYLMSTSLVRYGEYFCLLPMLKDVSRPFSLACQMIHPLRVRTPVDLMNDPRLRDGIELGEYGETVAIWVKMISRLGTDALSDVSSHFMRIPVKVGHRWNVIHRFVTKEPEQVRGMPFFAPAMKYMRDFSDLLNAELVSNVVTAALSYFIEVGAGMDPYSQAELLATLQKQYQDGDGSARPVRYEETYPGRIMYGGVGEKPHLLAANRPGTTFEPFTRTVKKSISLALNIPYPILFKDPEGLNFAGWRGAMLDAWRVFTMHRTWHGQDLQIIQTMLQEEAWTLGRLDIDDFHAYGPALTRCDWRGSPKGDIEPVKMIQAYLLANKGNLMSLRMICAEFNIDFDGLVEDLRDDRKKLEAAGLLEMFKNPDKPVPIPEQGEK